MKGRWKHRLFALQQSGFAALAITFQRMADQVAKRRMA
jgi:hypothetical protein